MNLNTGTGGISLKLGATVPAPDNRRPVKSCSVYGIKWRPRKNERKNHGAENKRRGETSLRSCEIKILVPCYIISNACYGVDFDFLYFYQIF